MKRRIVLAAVAGIALTAGGIYLAPTHSGATAPPRTLHPKTVNSSFYFTGLQSGLRLAAPGAGPGAVVTQQAAEAGAGQSLQLAAQQDGSFELRAVASGACITPAADGAVTTAACGQSAQRFTAAHEKGGFVFVHRDSGFTLTATQGTVKLLPRAHSFAEAWHVQYSDVNRVAVHARGMTAGGPAFAANTTVRVKAPLTATGSGARVTFSNQFGTGPLVIDSASVAVESAPGTPAAAPVRLTFSGASGVTIPAGGELASDAAGLGGQAGQTMLVTLHLAQAVEVATQHPLGIATTYLADNSDATFAMGADAFNRTSGSTYFVRSVDLASTETRRALAAIGDSITDGYASPQDQNQRWPDRLSERLRANGAPVASVVNLGISANKVTLDRYPTAGPAAVKRFDLDVVQQSGVTSVLIYEGINDVDDGNSSESIIAGLTELVRQARAADLAVNVATLPPFKGWSGWTPAEEQVRQEVNTWIRANKVRADSVQDFDAWLRDPSVPDTLLPAYDSGDHLHPNPAGFQTIASTIDLGALRL